MPITDRVRRLSVFLPLTLVIAMGLAILLGIISFGTLTLDNVARVEMRKRVQVALDIESQRLADRLAEFRYLDSAYRNLVVAPDEDWANGKIGNHLTDTGIDRVLVVDSRNRPTMDFVDGEWRLTTNSPPVIEGLDKYFESARESSPLVRYATVDGSPHVLALAPLTADAPAARRADAGLFGMFRRIDAGMIRDIATAYRLPGLSIARNPETIPDVMKLPLTNERGDRVITLTWKDRTPATDVRRAMRPWVIALGLVMTCLIFWVFYLEICNHRERESLLREMASIDHLTGISNRREFFVMADKVLSISKRANTPVSLMLLDVDNFKQINDGLGHSRGDRILALVGERLRAELREADVYARYGGDEFIVLLPGTNADAALVLAERLRTRIAQMSPEIAANRYAPTVSIGLVEHNDGESIDQLISRADDALYQAKYGGRNRSVKGSGRRLVFFDTVPSEGSPC